MSEAPVAAAVDTKLLDAVQRRVLWLAVRMVDAANHERETGDGVKVGGHQASSASMVTIMTALWFAHLGREDRASVKPHASPVFHAIQYLLGNLDRSYLTRLRALGGLQSYPSRTKDPDGVDFSTGSVGLGAVAPLWAAVTRRYVDAHFGPRPASRFVALIGDAELDEGSIWEAIADPATEGLGSVLWVVDFNRQSLDRVVPGSRIAQWRGLFEAAGWHVVEAKYGRALTAAFALPGGAELRDWIDGMANERYQALFSLSGPELRAEFLDGAPPGVGEALADIGDAELPGLVTDLGGHDLLGLLDAFRSADAVTDRPTVVFAYTVKGWGLPIAGNPRNHSALLTGDQMDALRTGTGLSATTEWDRFDPSSPEGMLCEERARLLARPQPEGPASSRPTDLVATGIRAGTRPLSTQDAFGRVLVDLSRHPDVGPSLVTTAPDVATSTNLAGFINRAGVFAPADRHTWADGSMLKWVEGPSGQHVELSLSEMNLFAMLGQLGLSGSLSGRHLIPVGTVYDPFVCRGLDAFIYSVYSGARFIVAGTPSGVTLASEGGAHQSTITPSIGLEMPGVTYLEPAYAVALDWLLCDAVSDVADPQGHGGAFYFRLSTRPIDQEPFEQARRRLGDDALRRAVLAGAYRLVEPAVDPATAPAVHIAAAGAVVPEAVAAATILADEGVAATVVDVTSPDRLYRSWRSTIRQAVRHAAPPEVPSVLHAAFGPRAPVVSVQDGSSHTLAWLGGALGVGCVPLGVDEFGQSGSVPELYRTHDLLPDSIVNAALAAIGG